MKPVPMMPGRIVRVDLDRTPMLSFSHRPIKVMTHGGETKRAVGLGRSRIQIDGFAGSLLGGRRAFSEGLNAKDTKPVVIISDARVGERVFRIEFDGVGVALECLGKPRFRISVPVIAASQI